MRAKHSVEGGNRHHVQIDGLKVWVYPSDGRWVAHGIDVDYATSGATAVEAQQAFAEGFSLTIVEHLRRFGSLERLLSRAAPDDVRRRWVLEMERQQVHRSDEPLSLKPAGELPILATVPKNFEFYRAAA
jgi:hypothetical protein